MGGAPNEVSAGVGKNILLEAFTHPMIPLTQNHFPSQDGIFCVSPPGRGAERSECRGG